MDGVRPGDGQGLTATGARADDIARLTGVTAASPESLPDVIIDLPATVSGGIESERFFDDYAVVDPAGYAAVHPAPLVAGPRST